MLCESIGGSVAAAARWSAGSIPASALSTAPATPSHRQREHAVGRSRVVSDRHFSVQLNQVSYHIQYLFFESGNRILREVGAEHRRGLPDSPERAVPIPCARARKLLGWPKRCKLAHAFL
jgi:hypothetical protein